MIDFSFFDGSHQSPIPTPHPPSPIPKSPLAIVGAGGKTTLCWRLTQAAITKGQRVIFTTATKIWRPAPAAFDLILIEPNMAQAVAILQQRPWQSACVVAGEAQTNSDIEPAQQARFISTSPDHMPVLPHKMIGYTPDAICELATQFPDCTLIIEADGARGALIKAPAEHEPMIPHCAQQVIVVASQDAIGQPLSADIAHRPQLISQLTGLALGDLITAQALNTLLTHPRGGQKNIPPQARLVYALSYTV